MYFISRYSKLTDLGLRLSAWQRWLLTTAGVLSITVVWYITAYNLLHAQQVRRRQLHQKLKSQQNLCNTLAHRADQLHIAFEAAQGAWAHECKQAQQRATSDALFTLFDAFGKHGVTVQAYYPHPASNRSWCYKQSAQLHLGGSFEQLLQVFDTLHDESSVYQWQQVRLERQEDTTLKCIATVSSKVPKESNVVI